MLWGVVDEGPAVGREVHGSDAIGCECGVHREVQARCVGCGENVSCMHTCI